MTVPDSFAWRAMVGSVNEEHVHLRRGTPFTGSGLNLQFYGTFKQVNGQTVLEGVFKLSPAVKIVVGGSLGALLSLALACILQGIHQKGGPLWAHLYPFLLPGMFFVGWPVQKARRNDMPFLLNRIRAALYT